MPEPLGLLQVHAHPDDEASKGAGVTARYHDEGVHTVLVCCTGGEAGEVLNPAMDRPEVVEHLAEIRMEELAESARILGYDVVDMLGYHDSGMPDTETNARPDNFANAPFDEAVGRLVRIIRAERPQVIITYNDERGYPHPDHLRVHEITGPAFDAAGDPDRYPEAGPAWQPQKLYETGWSRHRVEALGAAHEKLGQENPFARWFERDDFGSYDDKVTTKVDVGNYLRQRREALLAHRTQVDPNGFWMQLPDEVVRDVWPWEEYSLVRSLVPDQRPADGYEDDLFAGLR
ncbi:MAG: mycothiol conjugate amidase Mca [Actinomycetia bacterium]|nr:mycothiol conjugate amidase Mca [Actinomycetes bacterium]